jgi:hypothetical protein
VKWTPSLYWTHVGDNEVGVIGDIVCRGFYENFYEMGVGRVFLLIVLQEIKTNEVVVFNRFTMLGC